MRIVRLFRLGLAALRAFGPGWVAYRLRYLLWSRAGLFELRTRNLTWANINPLDAGEISRGSSAEQLLRVRRDSSPAFLFSERERQKLRSRLALLDLRSDNSTSRADESPLGDWHLFGGLKTSAGFPPDWHRNPLTGERAPEAVHWSRVGDFAHGDIKAIWEMSRFGIAYAFGRAYARTSDEKYAELYWTLLADWADRNPAARGVNWRCGQEASIRVMALVFGFHSFLHSPATTPERIDLLLRVLAYSGRRIEENLDYALSQFNNHGVSEGVGLYTIGILFPEIAGAGRWRQRGREVLEALGCDLIYDDGAFSQHSVNYHRLMLQGYLFAIALARRNQDPFSPELIRRVSKSADFLWQLQDAKSGELPVYGADDGSMILPLSGVDFRDFRPVLQAASVLLKGVRLFEPGLWDEEAIWLAGVEALDSSPLSGESRTPLWAATGGYYTLRNARGHAFLRCPPRFKHRPGHSDILHADLWLDGVNVALDPGTYGYNAKVAWASQFESAAVHNLITVDGRDQSERLSRFLSWPWPKAETLSNPRSMQTGYFEAVFDTSRKGVAGSVHRRAVVSLGDSAWLVIDGVTSAETSKLRLHWNLPDRLIEADLQGGRITLRGADSELHVRFGCAQGDHTASLVRADAASARGWRSPGYGRREPTQSLALEARAAETWFYTVFSTEAASISCAGQKLLVRMGAREWQVVIGVGSASPLAAVSELTEHSSPTNIPIQ